MARYLLEISYSGTNYHGWQMQPNAMSVQEVIEDCLSKMLRQSTKILGSGRTDTGVHALQTFAHFDFNDELPLNFMHRLNSFLPWDISIQSCKKVHPEFHARFDARERSYIYQISKKKNPFFNNQTWTIDSNFPDIEAMNRSAQELLNFTDFTAFAKLHSDNKTNNCDVRKAIWTDLDDRIKFEIVADRFLRNMVRSIVGTLVLVGKRKLSHDEFIDGIASKERSFVSNTAPAQGLFLQTVSYAPDIYI